MQLIHKYEELLPDYLQVMKEKGKPTLWLPKTQALLHERFCGHLNDRHFLIVDHDCAPCGAEKLYDIEPNFVVYNPSNPARHQAFWYLKDHVHCNRAAKSRKPYRFLRAIEAKFDEKYGADVHFSRHIHKNPRWWAADTDWPHGKAYTLSELAESVDMQSRRVIKSGARVVTDRGRNTTLFNDLRYWSYKHAEDGKKSEYEEWHSRIVTRAISLNSFTDPLPLSETLVIARSVAEFSYFRYIPCGSVKITEEYREQQAKRGAIGGKKSKGGGRRRVINEQAAELISEMLSASCSHKEIAERLGVSTKTIQREIAKKQPIAKC